MLGLRLKQMRNEKGQAMVELALVLPLLLILIFGIVEFGRVFNAYLIVNNAAREGARVGVVGATDTTITQKTKDTALTLDPLQIATTITPISSSRVRGAALTVAVEYPVTIYAPLIMDIVGNPYTVHGSATMRVE